MTLITFQSRIHFASNVLEEALRAELEESQKRRVLIIADAEKSKHIMLHRVQMGLPDDVLYDHVWIGDGQTKYRTADKVKALKSGGTFDAIIACGSSRAIAHGRKCRQTLAQQHYSALPKSAQHRKRIRSLMPDFFAIPGVDGLPDPCMAGGATAVEKTMPPNVIICDPSLIAGSSEADIANAYAMTLGRCLATFAGSSFNPLADGMAVEGLRRLASLDPLMGAALGTKDKSRDLMAATLNGAISQQKGPGLVQTIANALTQLTGQDVDSGSLQRILLPHLLRELDLISAPDEALVIRVLDASDKVPLSDTVEQMLDPLPLNRSLSELGYALKDWKRAVVDAQSRVHISDPIAARLNSIVEHVY